MKVLIVYDLIPEDTKQTIVEMSTEEYDYFSKVNNYIVNVSEYNAELSDIMDVIDWAFCQNDSYMEELTRDIERKYFGSFTDIEVIEDISDVDRFIHCGFYL
jgi:hypothetical protein